MCWYDGNKLLLNFVALIKHEMKQHIKFLSEHILDFMSTLFYMYLTFYSASVSFQLTLPTNITTRLCSSGCAVTLLMIMACYLVCHPDQCLPSFPTHARCHHEVMYPPIMSWFVLRLLEPCMSFKLSFSRSHQLNGFSVCYYDAVTSSNFHVQL